MKRAYIFFDYSQDEEEKSIYKKMNYGIIFIF